LKPSVVSLYNNKVITSRLQIISTELNRAISSTARLVVVVKTTIHWVILRSSAIASSLYYYLTIGRCTVYSNAKGNLGYIIGSIWSNSKLESYLLAIIWNLSSIFIIKTKIELLSRVGGIKHLVGVRAIKASSSRSTGLILHAKCNVEITTSFIVNDKVEVLISFWNGAASIVSIQSTSSVIRVDVTLRIGGVILGTSRSSVNFKVIGGITGYNNINFAERCGNVDGISHKASSNTIGGIVHRKSNIGNRNTNSNTIDVIIISYLASRATGKIYFKIVSARVIVISTRFSTNGDVQIVINSPRKITGTRGKDDILFIRPIVVITHRAARLVIVIGYITRRIKGGNINVEKITAM